MRVLFCAQPGSGHWRPLAPFAQALQASEHEHEVAFAVTPISAQEIERHGFRCFPTGVDDWLPEFTAQQQAIEAASLTGQTSSRPAEPKPPESVEAVWLNTFLPRAKRNLPELRELCHEWRPDLIVREQTEFGAWLAAELLGLPHAAIQVSAYRPRINRLIAPALERLRAELGLPVEPALSRLYPYLLLLPFPPGFIPAGAELPETAHFVQSTSYDLSFDASAPALDWLAKMPDQPNVYVTLGTAYNKDLGLFQTIIEALGCEPINLILTTNDIEPARFAGIVRRQPNPNSIRIERYLPQSRLLPQCKLAFSHGGFGTVRAAVAQGLPQVIMPIAADQPDNARRCAELGIALTLGRDQRSISDIRDAVMTVLSTPSYHERAASLRDKFRELPDLDEAVKLLEECVRQMS